MKLSEIIYEMEDDVNGLFSPMRERIKAYYLPKLKAINDEDWVSVEDRLPEEGQRVLVYYENDYKKKWRDVAFFTHGGVREFDDDNDDWPECYDEKKKATLLPKGFWFDSEIDEYLFHRLTVTHWRLIPTPPNIENKNSK